MRDVVFVGAFSIFEFGLALFVLALDEGLHVLERSCAFLQFSDSLIVGSLDFELLDFPGVELPVGLLDHHLEDEHGLEQENGDGGLVVESFDDLDHEMPGNQKLFQEGHEPVSLGFDHERVDLLDAGACLQVPVKFQGGNVGIREKLAGHGHKAPQQGAGIFCLVAALLGDHAHRLGAALRSVLPRNFLEKIISGILVGFVEGQVEFPRFGSVDVLDGLGDMFLMVVEPDFVHAFELRFYSCGLFLDAFFGRNQSDVV